MLSFSPFGGILFNVILILRLASSKELKSNETSLKTAETDIVYVQPEAKTVVKMIGNTTLTPPSLKVLNQILKNLESFSDQRVKELDSLSTRQSILSVGNASLADQLLSLRNGLSSLKPIKKTFGYKVTVYRSPSTADGKPMVVKEYFDQEDPGNGKEGKQEDLSSANSNSHDPVVPAPSYQHGVYVPQSGHQIVKEKDHGKKSEEHVHASHHHDRGLHKDSTKLLEHEEESHGSKHGGHHRESNENSHNQGEYGHDKAGASQTGVRERTEIEFFEKEHFLDTEHDKSKSGHENRNGHSESEVHDEHLSQQDHKAQGAHDSHSSHKDHGAAKKETAPVVVDNYGESSKYGHRVVPGAQQEDKHAVSGENANREHHSNQDSSKKSGLHGRHHSQQSSEDSSYSKKDKGRTKEGYRERGYKITTEREYFLKDAHHDTGFGKHNKGHQAAHLDKAKHGSEGGERHRDFKKEHATHDSHDVASDKKEGHRHDAEHHQGHEKGDGGEYYQQPDYLHGAPSGNLPAIAQKREGPQSSSSKTTKCKTCCRKYGQTTTKPPVRITPRQAKHSSTASGSVIHAVKSRINSTIPVVSNLKKTVENEKETDFHASPKPLEESRRRNITWPSSIQRLVSEKRKRPKGKIVRQRLPASTANVHTNSSRDLDSARPSERNGYRSSYAIVHPPSDGNIDNNVQALTTSSDYNREQGLKHPKTEPSMNRVRTEFPSTSMGPFRTKASTLAPVTSSNKEDYKYEPTVKPVLKYQFSPMPILSLYGGANSGLHYYEPNSGHSIIKTPVSEVKYLDDTDVHNSGAEVTGFTTPPYHRESYSTSRSNNMHVPKTFAGTYGSPIKQDYIPTYRDSPSREKQSYHSPAFLTSSESPSAVLTDNRGLYKYIISAPREGESYATTVSYSQPLLKSHPDYKQTGIWYAKKKK